MQPPFCAVAFFWRLFHIWFRHTNMYWPTEDLLWYTSFVLKYDKFKPLFLLGIYCVIGWIFILALLSWFIYRSAMKWKVLNSKMSETFGNLSQVSILQWWQFVCCNLIVHSFTNDTTSTISRASFPYLSCMFFCI